MRYLFLLFFSLVLVAPVNAQELTKKKRRGKYALFLEGDRITDYKYDAVHGRSYNHRQVIINDSYGLVNRYGKEVVPCTYDKLHFSSAGKIIALKGDNTGIIDTLDRIILPFVYERVDHVTKDTVALVRQDGIWSWWKPEKSSSVMENEPLVFKNPDELPMYPAPQEEGSTYQERKAVADRAMLNFIYNQVVYPAEARQKKIEGMVVVSFVVNPEGKIMDPSIVREIGGGCGEELLRIVKLLPDFTPGMVDEKTINARFYLPMKYKIN